MTASHRAAVIIAREAMTRTLTWHDLRAILPGVTDPTISKAIGLLIGDGIIERTERMPIVRYGWTGVPLSAEYDKAIEEVDRGMRVSTKLTVAEKKAIRAQRHRSSHDLAREHGVTVGTIQRIWGEEE